MSAFSIFHIFTFTGADDIAEVFFADLANGFQHLFGHKQDFAFAFYPGIFKVRMQRDRCVGRHGPRSSGPDNDIGRFALSCFWQHAVVFDERHFYEDRRRLFFTVFDFSFCQSGFAVRTPVNSFFTFIDIAFFCHLAENMDLYSFIIVGHGDIRMIPISKNAQTFEVGTLLVDPF